MSQNPADWSPATTQHLLLRRLERTDYDAALRIHTDPRTNLHNPVTPTAQSAAKLLQDFLDHWDREGFGYWAVAERDAPGTVIGFTGLQRALVDDREILNLYYRYDPAVWGRGYAKEGAREAVRRGRELLPELPVLARTTASNILSQRTAQAAGLQHRPELDRHYAGLPEVYLVLGWPEGSADGSAETGAVAQKASAATGSTTPSPVNSSSATGP
ncbi:GNAT family N-acetyltransferase [Arthrobacter sp. YD2]|uniref:GNAT family N-acetyltransferase n=1 Tax=Arthrobacter sp. YD2 TaxID=3058046 RepID=UPI0025B5FDB9|nr:GNAT family N-acetyltransferase [Arthrobacter sp. YD2]MDN3903334.1 GNAT family N-acetyltransferase [Arthrobacter sp. YD2]